jgi:hypothetical protein
MENQAAKSSSSSSFSGPSKMKKKEAAASRSSKDRQRYERNKRECDMTESERDLIGSDYEEFLWTYDPEKPYEDYLSNANTAEAESKRDKSEPAKKESK